MAAAPAEGRKSRGWGFEVRNQGSGFGMRDPQIAALAARIGQVKRVSAVQVPQRSGGAGAARFETIIIFGALDKQYGNFQPPGPRGRGVPVAFPPTVSTHPGYCRGIRTRAQCTFSGICGISWICLPQSAKSPGKSSTSSVRDIEHCGRREAIS